MLKLLFLLAIAANVILIVTSANTKSRPDDDDDSYEDNSSSSDSIEHCGHCGPDEQYSKCPAALCEPKTCAELGYPVMCPAQAPDGRCPGEPGCICKDGYLRNNKGKCIPKSQCPSCGGDINAKPGCGVHCNRRCSDIGKEPGACIDVCYDNACDCKKNYVFDDNTRKCVLPDQCTPTCSKNEVFSNCEKDCVCADGYLRDDNGACVPESECPNTKSRPDDDDNSNEDNSNSSDSIEHCGHCGPDEQYSKCPAALCEPKTCAELGYPVTCPAQAPDGRCPGEPGCICKDGYLRNNKGKCIPKSQCPSCGGDINAKPGCGVHCNRRCSDIGKEPGACILVCYDNACDCKKNYVFDDNTHKCVLPDQCTPTCPKNEVFSNCTNGGCSARNCSQLGKPMPCINLSEDACKKGCVCIDGYFRDDNGICVPESECHVCPTNEVYDKCSHEGQCSPGTCDSIGKSYSCPVQLKCKAECRCKDGYYRNEIGQCISKEECSKCAANQVYDLCPYWCPPRTCDSLGRMYACPVRPTDTCQPACRCLPGYYSNKIGQCITEEECLQCPGKHEYFSCGGACDNVCATLETQSQKNCPLINVACNKQCYCEEGYARDCNNTCIPIAECPATPTTTESPDCNDETALDRFSEGNTDFTMNFLYHMIKKNPLSSVVMSPFSVLIPLAELTLYTELGESYNQLMNALNLENKDEIRSVFSALLGSLEDQKNVTLDLGAKIYINENFQLTDKFLKDTRDIFDAEAENINFGDPDKAADIINAWADEITRGLIKTIVNPDMFSAATRLVLANAIYFLGNWVNQFDANNTRNEDFYISDDKTVQVPMMYRKGSYKYTESTDLDCKIVEIPYKGENFSYVILVPNQIDGYSTLAEKIRDPKSLNNALDALQFESCHLYVPRHEITSSIDLTEILNLLNITALFNSDTSNLSGILTNSEKLGVSDAIQKANIKVDETGTEAAAVTVIVVGTTSAGEPETVYEVKADRPFIFILYQDRQPLFSGAYTGN